MHHASWSHSHSRNRERETRTGGGFVIRKCVTWIANAEHWGAALREHDLWHANTYSKLEVGWDSSFLLTLSRPTRRTRASWSTGVAMNPSGTWVGPTKTVWAGTLSSNSTWGSAAGAATLGWALPLPRSLAWPRPRPLPLVGAAAGGSGYRLADE